MRGVDHATNENQRLARERSEPSRARNK